MNAGRVVMVPWISASDSGSSMYFCKRPAQRTRSVAAVGQRLVENPLLGFIGHRDGDRFLREILVQQVHHQFENLDEILLAESHEQNDFVQAVEELGVEGAFNFTFHQIFDFAGNHVFVGRLEAQALALLQVPRADVRRHDDDRVLEVHRVAETVGELAVFKDLQQDVEDIRDAPSRFRRAGPRSKARASPVR